MVKHIVMWKFNDEAEGKTKRQNLLYVKGLLEALPSKIDFIRSLEMRLCDSPKPDMYDAVLICEFDSHEAVEQYKVHPSHVEVSSYVRRVISSRASVDYTV